MAAILRDRAKKMTGYSEKSKPVGEYHYKAVLSDAEVECMRCMHEDGSTYAWLAKTFEVSVHSVGRICRYERRNTPIFERRDGKKTA